MRLCKLFLINAKNSKSGTIYNKNVYGIIKCANYASFYGFPEYAIYYVVVTFVCY